MLDVLAELCALSSDVVAFGVTAFLASAAVSGSAVARLAQNHGVVGPMLRLGTVPESQIAPRPMPSSAASDRRWPVPVHKSQSCAHASWQGAEP